MLSQSSSTPTAESSDESDLALQPRTSDSWLQRSSERDSWHSFRTWRTSHKRRRRRYVKAKKTPQGVFFVDAFWNNVNMSPSA